MKRVLLVLLLLISTVVQAQQVDLKLDPPKPKNNYIIIGTLALLGGAADGINQKISFHYDEFKARFPGADDQFWNPGLSWTNKYKNHDPTQGRRSFLSTSVLVWTTDGYHLTRFISHATTAGAISVKVINGSKKKWYIYAIEGIGYWIVNRVGFNLTYKLH